MLRRVGAQRDILGESPVWDDALGALFWVDIRAPALRRYDWAGGAVETRAMPGLVGSIALARPGRLLIAHGRDISLYDWQSGAMTPVAALPDARPGMRFNDGRCDRQGRFWVGTMHNETRGPSGALFRLDAQGLTQMRGGVDIPNSLSWSPDGTRMYFADSPRRTIECFDYDLATATPSGGRVFATHAAPGFADGSTVDADGFLWNAEFNSGKIVRYAPDGRIDRAVDLPLRCPTSCGFGGPDLRHLFITSTSQRMSEAELAAQPMAGALMVIDASARGLPEPRWSGDAA